MGFIGKRWSESKSRTYINNEIEIDVKWIMNGNVKLKRGTPLKNPIQSRDDDANGLYKLCDHIYPASQLANAYHDPDFFRDRAILTLRNDTAEEINTHIQRGIVDEEQLLLSTNKSDANTTENQLDESYLQTIRLSALPNHELRLKRRSPIMLMRNLHQQEGLCNGSRMTITNMSRHCIEAQILGGAMHGERRLIPRIKTTVDVASFSITPYAVSNPPLLCDHCQQIPRADIVHCGTRSA